MPEDATRVLALLRGSSGSRARPCASSTRRATPPFGGRIVKRRQAPSVPNRLTAPLNVQEPRASATRPAPPAPSPGAEPQPSPAAVARRILLASRRAAAPRARPPWGAEPVEDEAWQTLTARLDAEWEQRRAARETPPVQAALVAKPFVRWAVYAAQHEIVRSTMPHDEARPRGLRLLCAPCELPPDYKPRVHGLAPEPRELAKRALEATRIVPAVAARSWARILDEDAHTLRSWPPATLRARELDAVCAIAGHSRLAAIRTHLVSMDNHARHEYGFEPLEIMSARVSMSMLKSYLQERSDAQLAREQLARSRKAERAGLPPPPVADEEEGGAASAALSVLKTAAAGLCLEWPVDHQQLRQFAARPPTREDGGAPEPPVTLPAHFELGAQDGTQAAVVRGCFALAALQANVGTRTALHVRSRVLRRASNGMAVGAAGMDLKKRRWRSAGRPLLASVYGSTGSEVWFITARGVLDHKDFNARHKSLLRAHDGVGGDPRRATGWLDRPPTDKEWQATLDVLVAIDVHTPTRDGSWARVSPHLLYEKGNAPPHLTKQ